MARKRTQKRTKAPAQSNAQASCDQDGAAFSFTLEQALAELDRLTPWSRTLPCCKALLQAEIKRLRAEGNDAGAGKSAGPAVPAARPAPHGPLSRESSGADAGKDTPCPEAGSEAAAPAVSANGKPDLVPGQPCSLSGQEIAKEEGVSACPDHWDSEEEAQTSTYLDGSLNDSIAPKTAEPVEQEKSQIKIRIPVEEYPGYNFIGRLLGPRGATLKHLEVSSKCRLYIRGRGSLRSSDMNHEASKASLPGFEHLAEDLHVLVEYDGPSEDRENCLGIASRLVAPLLIPPASDEQDELKKQQVQCGHAMRELKDLAILNGTYKENKQLLPVCNKRVIPGGVGANGSAAFGANGNPGPMGRAFGGGGKCKETPMQQMQKGQQGGGAAGAAAGGINPNIMIQVMAQQLFLQEQHKMKMRLGLQQAQQQVMANRQQGLSSNVNAGLSGGGMQLGTFNSNPHNGPAAGPFANPTSQSMMNHNNNSISATGMNAGNGPVCPRNGNITANQHVLPNAPNRPAFGAVGNNAAASSSLAGAGGNSGDGHARGRSNQVSTTHNRSRVVSVEAKPFVPSLGCQVDAQPFVPNSMTQQQQQRGRSNSQGPPQHRSFSQGPPQKQGFKAMSGADLEAASFTPGKGATKFSSAMRDENWDPQTSQWRGAPDMGSPSFLTCMPTTPRDLASNSYERQDGCHPKMPVFRTGSAQSGCTGALDDSVDKSWGAALPFDAGWEGGDADSSVNSSFNGAGNTRNGGRGSPPGARGAHQRWHPYSRSPPKASPDFSAKVLALCSASFAGHAGNSGSYSLF